MNHFKCLRLSYRQDCMFALLKSLIIHEDKAKEITTVKAVCKCDLNYREICWSLVLDFSKNYYHTRKTVLSDFRSWLKNTPLFVRKSDKTRFLVFEIIQGTCVRRFKAQKRVVTPCKRAATIRSVWVGQSVLVSQSVGQSIRRPVKYTVCQSGTQLIC